jgi:hypothetical protein
MRPKKRPISPLIADFPPVVNREGIGAPKIARCNPPKITNIQTPNLLTPTESATSKRPGSIRPTAKKIRMPVARIPNKQAAA